MPIEADDYLCRFLRPCKWYPQSAFELVSEKPLANQLYSLDKCNRGKHRVKRRVIRIAQIPGFANIVK